MNAKILIGLLTICVCCLSNAYAQITVPLVTSSSNINVDRALIDHPQLNGNPRAIISVTANNDKSGNEYPHPVGVRYMPDNKWYVINTDQSKMQPDKSFSIGVWAAPDANHFVHRVTARGSSASLKNGKSRIDHPGLDNHPRAFFTIFPMRSYVTGDTVNDNAPSRKYNEAEKKWYIESSNGKEIYEYNAFNIIIVDSGMRDMTQPDPILVNPKPPTQTPPQTNPSTSPSGTAGGDLNGNYPNPNVIGLQGRPVSNTQPKVGDALKWDGTQWKPTGQEQTVITETTPFPNSNPNANTAAEPLKFKPVLGKKIIFYPGQTGDAGIGVAGNLLQIYSDNPNADVAIGYDQSGTFKERLRVKANGALEVNGNAGKPGEVLVSKGSGEPPVWSPMSVPVFAFANCEPDGPNVFLGVKCTAQAKTNESAPMEALRVYLTLKKPSIVIMNARFRNSNEGSAIFVTANGTRVSPLLRYESQHTLNFVISDLMFRLEPGTYTLDCRILVLGTQNGGVAGEYVSYAAYPID